MLVAATSSSFLRDITSVVSCPAAFDLNKKNTSNYKKSNSSAQKRHQGPRKEEHDDEDGSLRTVMLDHGDDISQLSLEGMSQLSFSSTPELKRRSCFGWVLFMGVLLHVLFVGTYFYIESIDSQQTPDNTGDASIEELRGALAGTHLRGRRHGSRSLPQFYLSSPPQKLSTATVYASDHDEQIITTPKEEASSLASPLQELGMMDKNAEESPVSEFIFNVQQDAAALLDTTNNRDAYASNTSSLVEEQDETHQ
uniref:Uncharacterized protein n=1 Tax=Grammatophora oceanica TaxID=210454 RepID=A0A7S1Y5Q5_9STRA|mmetsp:Transcript_28646/g.42199  ORF Transcript_28646/g.42199 Transcript_28646/m.42199 type:complete len:253 (+) Transcript_28646:58-816(+)|eukprot:CAMPEP_0194046698 /NCGR_PEP_ID=MMETSP0009_2-20130614/22252_1 /TAXON_ID=210454 /ORGANISM="Grammatophora oceanica, Strain CCMP 410" /LENGTH=252 /DNA_ID=CAMNT_0038692097 /DNA_START=57 /DNA_END=815 /DNA_ORIENTATION=-